MVPKKGREEFYRQCHQVIWEDVGVYQAQQVSLDSDPEGPSADNVNAKVRIDFDGAFFEARRVIKRMLKEEAALAKAKKARKTKKLTRRKKPDPWISVRGEQQALQQAAE